MLIDYYLKDFKRATAEFDRAFALNSALLHSRIGRALVYALRHQQAEGLKLMGQVEQSVTGDGEMAYKVAQAYAQLGDQKSALRLLQKSIALNFYPYSYFRQDPLLEPIRSEAQYSTLLELARQDEESFQHRFF